jgi:hypothetical protein
MKTSEEVIVQLQDIITQSNAMIILVNENKHRIEQLSTCIGSPVDYIDSWNSSSIIYLSWIVSVNTTIPATMSPILERLDLEGLIPIESWNSTDDLKYKQRNFFCMNRDSLYITISAVLTDESQCTMAVVGYETVEVNEVVKVLKEVPITKIICPE